MVKEPFSNLKIAIYGDFGTNWTKATMAKFISNNGGEVVPAKSGDMTHLITTIKCFEEQRDKILFLKSKNIFVVTFDWFEDSLQDRRKKLESRYDVAKVAKERRSKKEARAKMRRANQNAGTIDYARSVLEAKDIFMMGGYEIYTDPTGFAYDITLLRIDVLRNKTEKTIIKLFRTHQAPHYFACSSTYVTQNGSSSTAIEAPTGSKFEHAFQSFQNCYMSKTLKHWDQRADTQPVTTERGKFNERAYVWNPPDRTKIGMFGPFVLDDDGFLVASHQQAHLQPPSPRVVEISSAAADEADTDTERGEGNENGSKSDGSAGGEEAHVEVANSFNSVPQVKQVKQVTVEQDEGIVGDRAVAIERVLDGQQQLRIPAAQEELQLQQERQARQTGKMHHGKEEPRVALRPDADPMPTGIVTGSWGGMTFSGSS